MPISITTAPLTAMTMAMIMFSGGLIAAETTSEKTKAPALPCQEMSAARTKLMEDVRSQDVLLTERLANLKTLAIERHPAEVEALVILMAEQRVAVDQRHAVLMDEMAMHMAGRGKDGAMCPMMKPAKDEAAKPAPINR